VTPDREKKGVGEIGYTQTGSIYEGIELGESSRVFRCIGLLLLGGDLLTS